MGIGERMTDKKVVKKDKHCIGCKHFFTCAGKPHRNPCLNKEKRDLEEEKNEQYKMFGSRRYD